MEDAEILFSQVFSAHAEVVPASESMRTPSGCILRARGGSSIKGLTKPELIAYSPRTRR